MNIHNSSRKRRASRGLVQTTEPDKHAITRVGVVGAGLMGLGIAESAARVGADVVIYDNGWAALDSARSRLTASLGAGVHGGKLSAAEATATAGRVAFSNEPTDLSGSQLAVEAVTEDEETKRAVFADLDRMLGPDAIIASNTSSIPIAHLAAATERSDRVLGLHFFAPVPVMKLVEVIVSLETAPATIEVAEQFVRHLGKTPIRTKDRSGFLVNFLLVPYLMAAVRLYEEGFAERDAIETAMKLGCGHPMGPLALCDFIGLDVLYAVCDSLYEEFRRPEYAPPPLLRRMVAAGHLGRKAGQGFYEYESDA